MLKREVSHLHHKQLFTMWMVRNHEPKVMNSQGEPQTPLKWADEIICEWSVHDYKDIFENQAHPTYWAGYQHYYPVPQTFSPARGPKQHLHIDDCLDEFSRVQELGEDASWYCPACDNYATAKTMLQLWRIPDIFVIQLKRFNANGLDKAIDFIEFPLTDWDLTDRVGDKGWIEKEHNGEMMIYDLFAVGNHSGGLKGGHYTGYVENFDGKWYLFNGISQSSWTVLMV
jgi:ubiquitin carboxyl-terminal hydrolase 4/11/15